MRVSSLIHTPVVLLCSLGLSFACGIDGLIPDTAAGAGEPAIHVQPVIEAPANRSLPPGISRIDLEVQDILLHHEANGAWLILNDKDAIWSTGTQAADNSEFSAVPIPEGNYDAVRVVFGAAKVEAQGQSFKLNLPETQREQDFTLRGDQTLHVSIDVAQNLQRTEDGEWSAEPEIRIQLRNADFSGQQLRPLDGPPQSPEASTPVR